MEAMIGYFAVNQYGEKLIIDSKHPRQWLLKRAGLKNARKMYSDLKSGGVRHIGWIVGTEWWTVYRVDHLNGDKLV